MTCIVGLLKDGVVYMAGDHIATDGYCNEVQKRSKVFRNGDFIIGYTESFRMGQILEHKWEPPKLKKGTKDVTSYIVKSVIPSLIECFDKNKFIRSVSDSDSATKRSISGQVYGGEFLLGYKNHLYKVESDFSVLECVNNYDAVGAGEEYAKGALFAFYQTTNCDPVLFLKGALLSAEKHCSLVHVDWNNFKILSTKA